jgi:hypothetical protein
MNLNRRNFLSGVAIFSLLNFIGGPKVHRTKIAAKCSMKFNDGKTLEMLVSGKDKDGKFFTLNSMNHYKGIMTTEFDLENVFYGHYDLPSKMTISYKGYDKFDNLIYEATGDNKVWKDYSDQNYYVNYIMRDGIPVQV